MPDESHVYLNQRVSQLEQEKAQLKAALRRPAASTRRSARRPSSSAAR